LLLNQLTQYDPAIDQGAELLTGGLLVRIRPEEPAQQLADDKSFAGSSRCPFPSAFHAGFSFALKSSRMLAQRQLLLALISSQPIHLQYDPVGESRHGPLSVHSLELRASKVLPVGEVYGV
jgi:hypothetical protein